MAYRAVLLALALFAARGSGRAADMIFSPAEDVFDTWENSDNWYNNADLGDHHVPGVGDIADITYYTAEHYVTLDSEVAVAELDLGPLELVVNNGATLNAGRIHINGVLNDHTWIDIKAGGTVISQDNVTDDAPVWGILANGSPAAGITLESSTSALTVLGNLYVGHIIDGGLVQKNGATGVAGRLIIGQAHTATSPQEASSYATGTYELDGGSLGTAVLASGITHAETIGDSAIGTFTQNGGLNDATSSGIIDIGNQYGSVGTYTLNAGVLDARDLTVAVDGQGTFTQNGGTVNLVNQLSVGASSGTGQYNLKGGALNAAVEVIGGTQQDYQYFVQTGGVNTISTNLKVQGSGKYRFEDGALNAPLETIGGTFSHEGSTNNVQQLNVSGLYDMSGGNLTADNVSISATNSDTGYCAFDHHDGGGIVTISGNLSLGQNAGTRGTYNMLNDLNFAGQTLSAYNERVGVAGAGTFYQSTGTNNLNLFGVLDLGVLASGSGVYSYMGGTLNAATITVGDAGTGIFAQSVNSTNVVAFALNVGKEATGDGTFALGAIYETILGDNLEVTGYQLIYAGDPQYDGNPTTLSATNENIGIAGNGIFHQSATSTNLASILTLGVQDGGTGTYYLPDGANLTVSSLLGGNETIGQAGTGSFHQTGGTHIVSNNLQIGVASTGNVYQMGGSTSTLSVGGTLSIGVQSGAVGTFSQIDGAVSAANELIGVAGTGTYDQSHGTNTVAVDENSTLQIGTASGGIGNYNLSGGTLSAVTEIVGNSGGTGNFTQTGGANTTLALNALGYLIVGNGGGQGTYTLHTSTGTITSNVEEVGVLGGSGVFNHQAGTNTLLDSNLDLGTLFVGQAGGTGYYYLSGSVSALAATEEYMGYGGQGNFSQSDGTNTVGNLKLASATNTSFGSYSLSGGTLSANMEIVGDKGSGTFTHTAGTNTVTQLLVGNETGSSGNYFFGAIGLEGGGGVATLNAVSEVIGSATATGMFSQNGNSSTNTVTYLNIGEEGASGSYSLAGGNLTTGGTSNWIVVGSNGTLLQSGGTLTAGNSHGSFVVKARGSYTMSGGTENGYLVNNGSFVYTGSSSGLGGGGGIGGIGGGGGGIGIVGSGSAPTFNGFLENGTGGSVTITGDFVAGQGILNYGNIPVASNASIGVGSGTTLDNEGTVDLQGGSIKGSGPVLNNGTIQGSGAISTDLDNRGIASFNGSDITVNGNVTNAAGHTVTIATVTGSISGTVTNNGAFKTAATTVTYGGTFTNNGSYASDPSTQNFTNLVIGTNGSITGGAGDLFNVSGDVTNNSTQSTAFDISTAQLTLQGSASHLFAWSGADFGADATGYANNFAIGIFEIESGGSVTLLDGDAISGAGIYVGTLKLADGLAQIVSIIGNGANIYYNPAAPDNAYLNGETYALQNGGAIIPVPEPGTSGMLGVGVAILVSWRLRFRRCTV